MGLNDEIKKKTFLHISKGKVIRNEKQPFPGSAPTEKGRHEKAYASISGLLVGITTKTGEYNGKPTKDWVVTIKDGDDLYSLSFMYSGGNANGFLFRIKNANLKQPIEFRPFFNEAENRSWIVLYQNDKMIPQVWNKENNWDGLPKLEEIKNSLGKTISWDDEARMKFFEDMIAKEIVPNLPGATEQFLSEGSDIEKNAKAGGDAPKAEGKGVDFGSKINAAAATDTHFDSNPPKTVSGAGLPGPHEDDLPF